MSSVLESYRLIDPFGEFPKDVNTHGNIRVPLLFDNTLCASIITATPLQSNVI